MAVKRDIERYRKNYIAEQEGSELYQTLSRTERDPHLAELYRRMAETEQRHASVWADYLRKAGEAVHAYTPGWRIHMIIWLAQRFGVNSVLPMISSMERGASHDYDTQPEARAAGMPKDERSHERLFRSVELTGGGVALDTLAREELGIDPGELGGSAWTASIMSFMLFAVGAIIPVIPFAFGSGLLAVLVSLLLGTLGLFIIGVGITLTTGAPLLKSAGRQTLLGLLAAAITFGPGSLVGGRLG